MAGVRSSIITLNGNEKTSLKLDFLKKQLNMIITRGTCKTKWYTKFYIKGLTDFLNHLQREKKAGNIT